MALCVMNSHLQREINQESRYFEKRKSVIEKVTLKLKKDFKQIY